MRVGVEGGGTGDAGGAAWGIGSGGGGRNGVDVELPVFAEGRADGVPAGQPGNDRFDDQRWLVGRLRELPHGRDRRKRGREIQDLARGAGPVRIREPSKGGSGDQIVFFWRADCAGGDSAEEGRSGDRQDGRIPARGYFDGSAG